MSGKLTLGAVLEHKEMTQAKERGGILTRDIPKGTTVRLRNGWRAEVVQKVRGNTGMLKVFGYVTEIGSVYSHDIVAAQIAGEWVKVKHTAEQLKCQEMVKALGF